MEPLSFEMYDCFYSYVHRSFIFLSVPFRQKLTIQLYEMWVDESKTPDEALKSCDRAAIWTTVARGRIGCTAYIS